MRKNVFNNNILMVSKQDLFIVYNNIYEKNDEELLKRFGEYAAYFKTKDASQEVGILLEDSIDKRISNCFLESFLEIKDISLEDIKNTFIYFSTHPTDDTDLRSFLGNLLISREELSRESIIFRYGEKVLYYILNHRNYDYETDYNPVFMRDAEIVLCYNGLINKQIINKEEKDELKR